MTSPEQTPGAEHGRDLPTISRDEADRLIEELMPLMPTRRAAKRIQDLYEQSGPPVAVFLYFEDVNPTAEDIEQQFHGYYFGSFTRDEVIQTGIEIAEYDVALERFLLDRDLPEDAADWNFDALWPVIRDQYLIVQEGNYFHVFDSSLMSSTSTEEQL